MDTNVSHWATFSDCDGLDSGLAVAISYERHLPVSSLPTTAHGARQRTRLRFTGKMPEEMVIVIVSGFESFLSK